MLFGGARTAALNTVCRRLGCTPAQTEAALLVVKPFASKERPADRLVAKQVDAMAQRFARTAHKAASALELQERSYVALSAFAYLMREAGDEHYTPLFEAAAYACRVEITPERLEQLKAAL